MYSRIERVVLPDRRFAAGVAVCLALYNNFVHLVPGHRALYVPLNLALAAGLLWLARHSGLSWSALGLDRGWLRRGLAWGVGPVLAVTVAYGAALVVPAGRDLLQDERVAGLSAAELAYQTLVRIPFGTVVLEEVAFRAVLLAAWGRVHSVRAAVMVSSALFGLWHVRPTLSALEVNDLAGGPWERTLAVGGAVAFTAGAGLVFCWLRLRAESLLAPASLHVAVNSFGTVAAFFAHRWG